MDIQGPEAGRRLPERCRISRSSAQAWLIRAMAGRRGEGSGRRHREGLREQGRRRPSRRVGDPRHGRRRGLDPAAAQSRDDRFDGRMRAVAFEALASLPGDDINKTLIARLGNADLQEGRVLIGVLVRRDAAEVGVGPADDRSESRVSGHLLRRPEIARRSRRCPGDHRFVCEKRQLRLGPHVACGDSPAVRRESRRSPRSSRPIWMPGRDVAYRPSW